MSIEASFSDGTLNITRTYDALREVVFEAWVETSKVQQWYGCAQTTSVRSEIEPKVGGVYNHAMTMGEMGEHDGKATFTVFDPPNKLAFTSEAQGGMAAMTVTVEFIEEDGGTRVRLTHENIPEGPAGPDMPDMPEIIQAGWTAGLNKLGEFLITLGRP